MEWISVNDKFPLYKQEVLVWMGGVRNPKYYIDLWMERIAIGYLLREDESGKVWITFWGHGSQEGHVVTHWMPLPEPPVQNQSQTETTKP